MIRKLSRFLSLVLFCSLVGLSIGSIILRWSLAHLDDYHSELEHWVADLTTLPIQIGTLEAHINGFNPRIVMTDIRVNSKILPEQTLIHLDEIHLNLDWWALLKQRELLAACRLSLIGVDLSVTRQRDGRLVVEGLHSGDDSIPYWLFQGGQYQVLHSRVRWRDLMQAAPERVFNDVDIFVENESADGRHELHLISELPEHFGERVRISMAMEGRLNEGLPLNGLIYLKASDLYLDRWLNLAALETDYRLSGRVAVEQWLRFNDSTLSLMGGHLLVDDLVLEQSDHVLQIPRLDGFFAVRRADSDWQLDVKRLKITQADNVWPTIDFRVKFDDQFNIFNGFIQQLDLQQIAWLAEQGGAAEEQLLQTIKTHQPQGRLQDMAFSFDRTNQQFAVRGQFKNLSLEGSTTLPLIRNFSGYIDATNSEGTVILKTHDAQFAYQDMFRAPLDISHLSGQLQWQQQAEHWQIQSHDLSLITPLLAMNHRLTMRIPAEGPLFMDLATGFKGLGDIHDAKTYFPVSIMDESVVNWLDQAFIAGNIPQGELSVYGDLVNFPFLGADGVFQVLYDMHDTELHFAPGWPNLTNMKAQVLFESNGVAIQVQEAQTLDLQILPTEVAIPSFSDSQHVEVNGKASGTVKNALLYLTQTPIGASLQQLLDVLEPEGDVTAQLKMAIAMSEQATSQVAGETQFNDTELLVKSVGIPVKNLTGSLQFSENGLSAKSLTAQALGYPLSLKIGGKYEETRIDIEGRAAIKALQKHFPFLQQGLFKKAQLQGSTEYQLTMNVPGTLQNPSQLLIKSFMQGTAFALPDGLIKQAPEKKPLNLRFGLDDPSHLPVQIDFNDQIKALLTLKKTDNNLDVADILIGSGQLRPTGRKGIHLTIDRDEFDATAWLNLLQSDPNEIQQSEASESLSGLTLLTRHLNWQGNDLGPVEIHAFQEQGDWHGDWVSKLSRGIFNWPKPQNTEAVIDLQLSYLNLSDLSKVGIKTDQLKTEALPLFNLHCDNLWWHSTNLGQLDVITESIADGIRFKTLKLISAKQNIDFKADWIKTMDGSHTELMGRLTADDFGQFLSNLGWDNDLLETPGSIDILASWPGTPTDFSLLTLEADANLLFQDGRISSIEPGIGRILGLIAMEQWVKRLRLDFDDIFQEGLSFNSIRGHLRVRNGKAMTKDLVVDGIAARIGLSGTVDFTDQTLDHEVTVIPKSSGALPIAGNIVSTIAGTITEALTDDYKEGYFFGSKYHIKGPWDNITVTPLSEQDGLITKTWTDLTDFFWTNPQTNPATGSDTD